MSSQPSEQDARNVMTALNGLRRHSGSSFTVTVANLQQRSGADAATVERVMARLQERPGYVVKELDSGEWEVRRS